MPQRVGVVGAGYAGLAALARLQRLASTVRPDLDLEMELVNPAPRHVFVTELHTVAAGVVGAQRVASPLLRFLRPDTAIRVDTAVAVLPDGLGVDLASGVRRYYDALILTPGWEPEYYGIPGLRAHAWTISDLQSAVGLRNRLRQLVAAPPPGRVIVAGAGLTGVELAAEVADIARGRLETTLVEAAPRILAGLPPRVAELAGRILRDELGVQVLTGDPVAAATPGELRLHSGQAVPFDILIWCGGVRGSRLLAASGLPCNRRGQVETGPGLEVPGRPGLFVAGDAAAVVDPGSGAPLPPSAQLAARGGAAAALGVVRRLAGREPPPFIPHLDGYFISLGRHRGVGVVGDAVVSGLAAVALKHSLESAHAGAAGGPAAFLGRALGIEFPGGTAD